MCLATEPGRCKNRDRLKKLEEKNGEKRKLVVNLNFHYIISDIWQPRKINELLLRMCARFFSRSLFVLIHTDVIIRCYNKIVHRTHPIHSNFFSPSQILLLGFCFCSSFLVSSLHLWVFDLYIFSLRSEQCCCRWCAVNSTMNALGRCHTSS